MEDFIQRLQNRLKEPLPGLPVQMEMAPPARGKADIKVPDNARHSAVLVLLYPHQHQPHLLFMKRAEDGHVHSGQISFPGGKVEKNDRDYVDTALREAHEELGIPREKVRILGPLSEMYIPPSNFLVYPSLGYMPHRPDFILDPVEVAHEIEVALPTFHLEGVRAVRTIEQRTPWGQFRTQAPSFLIEDHLIWGATSMILNELLTIVRDLD